MSGLILLKERKGKETLNPAQRKESTSSLVHLSHGDIAKDAAKLLG